MRKKRATKALKDRFFSKVSPEPNSGCWLWTGAVNSRGYGDFNTGQHGKHALAHRVSYELHKGQTGTSCVLHSCDNPSCVNPVHLFLGSKAENVADMDRKGRRKSVTPFGENAANAKLTEMQVRSIKAALKRGQKQTTIAAFYGVHKSLVSLINTGKHWAHVVD